MSSPSLNPTDKPNTDDITPVNAGGSNVAYPVQSRELALTIERGIPMEKMARVSVYPENALRITATLEDFNGTVSEWKIAFYELWRYQMTWHFAYEISVIDSRNSGVFVLLKCKPAYKKNILETMESLGFKNINCEDEEIGAIECTDFPDDMLIDTVIVDY